jgi:hypothetical protein
MLPISVGDFNGITKNAAHQHRQKMPASPWKSTARQVMALAMTCEATVR